MGLLELFLIAVGLSMDAFAVSVCTGLSLKKINWKKAFVVGAYFGFFQAAMPLIGYIAGSQFADKIEIYDHWIAFLLLVIIGGKLIKESFNRNSETNGEASLKMKAMLPLALATSIDALAVGITFAFLNVNIVHAVSLIGVVTLVLSMLGVKVGNIFGAKFKSKAELAGGIILILIGLKILLEHTGILVLYTNSI